MSVSERIKNFQPPGPVASAFLRDRTNDVRMLLGPVGGGKSVTCLFDCLSNASQMPACSDGVIRYRVAVIGSTYGQIERNLYPTWTTWLPRDGGDWTEGEWTGGGGRFAIHKIRYATMRGGKPVPVDFEAIFAAIGEQAIEQFMRGFEPTAFWLYEVDQLPEDVLNQAIPRLGRYPAQHMLPANTPFRSYIVGDLNAPDIDSWFYKRFEEVVPKGHKLYKQPSGRSPQAENIPNLPAGYYQRQVDILSQAPRGKWLVRRMVDAQYAPSLDGEPVYSEYSDDIHLSPEPLQVLPNRPLRAGFDQGLRRPAAVIYQPAPNGQFRILAEVVPGRMSARRFAEQVRLVLTEIAPGRTLECGYADPAGFIGADKEDGELAWAETVSAELGCPIYPAPSNEIDLRVGAVVDELIVMIEPHVPALIIDRKRCPMLRKGFASHYRYERVRVGNTTKTSDKPEKNDWSNPHDGLQYAMLGEKGRAGAVFGTREKRGPAAGRDRRGQSESTSLQVNVNLFGSG